MDYMNKKTKRKLKRRMTIGIFVLISVVSFFGYALFKDWIQIINNKKQLSQLTTYYNELLTEEKVLSSEVVKLHDDDYVARYAREKYMYSYENETIFKIPDSN